MRKNKAWTPDGEPKYIRCYEEKVENVMDPYTVVFTKALRVKVPLDHKLEYYRYVGMSEHPTWPCGVGQHGENRNYPIDRITGSRMVRNPPKMRGKCHLGVRIPFDELPQDCKSLVLRDYKELWGEPS